ncbi:hypothetical protein lerEdw1_020737 [Lerista edwardsae]|nr:hypothetical protein lerEdw1_020737 [Lerista edwardsae]
MERCHQLAIPRPELQKNRPPLKITSISYQVRELFGVQDREPDGLILPGPGSLCRPPQQGIQTTTNQAEEFFEMVAKAQARRLDDQRADFAAAEDKSEGNTVVSEEQLYDTILAHQSQRLEDQRTEPPIPVGIQGLLDLLLTAQGARMEDQRSALPPALTSPSLLGGPPTFLGQFVTPPADSSLERMWF